MRLKDFITLLICAFAAVPVILRSRRRRDSWLRCNQNVTWLTSQRSPSPESSTSHLIHATRQPARSHRPTRFDDLQFLSLVSQICSRSRFVPDALHSSSDTKRFPQSSYSMWQRTARIRTFRNNISFIRPERKSASRGRANERSTSTSTSSRRLLIRGIIKNGQWRIPCISTGQ